MDWAQRSVTHPPPPLDTPPLHPFTFASPSDANQPMLDDVIPFIPTVDVPITVAGLSTPTTQLAGLSSMADSGANVCITNDSSILINIRTIKPIPLGVALSPSTTDTTATMCTQQGELPIPLLDGSYHFQPFLINQHATDTILSPAHVMKSSSRINAWSQSGSESGSHDSLTFTDVSGTPLLILPLTTYNGLQYCSYSSSSDFSTPIVRSTISYPATEPTESVQTDPEDVSAPSPVTPTSCIGLRRVLEAELWAARLGFCSEWQLQSLPKHAQGLPSKFYPHPLRFVEHKEQAKVKKQATGSSNTQSVLPGQRFGMDFGFIRASTSDYKTPNLVTDRVVESFDGFVAYLIIVDEHSKYVWVFLRKSKEPPIDLVSHFLQMYGRKSGGVIRCDQGGELAHSQDFRSRMLENHLYVVEPTGADSPSQNGGTEKWNDTLAVTTRALLYGASLPAKYWSAAITHAAYLHNRRVHFSLHCTPYERWYGTPPNLKRLRVFGSRICVKRTGHRRAKLDKHSFTGIFIGYAATDANVRYIDMESGLVKTSHHAVFDECWFHQPWRPPAADLLYSLGIQLMGSYPDNPASPPALADDASVQPMDTAPDTPSRTVTPSTTLPPPNIIPMDEDDSSTDSFPDVLDSQVNNVTTNRDAVMVDHYGVSRWDVAQVYFSPHCFGYAFEETFTYSGSATLLHPSAGLVLELRDDRLYVTDIASSTLCAKIPRWRSRIRNTWLTCVNDTPVATLDDAARAFSALPQTPRGVCILTLASSELRDGLTNEGIPQISLDQLNPRHFFAMESEDAATHPGTPQVMKSWDGGVLQYLTRASKLTRGVLLKQDDWEEWQQSEFIQLDQYELQNMFGDPVIISEGFAVFNLVWSYAIKEVDGRKKARCTCDGSTRGGQVRVLDFTYANSPDHTCSRILYALAAGENLLIFGADVSNAFAEAPPPKQGFYIRPDPAFRAWWTLHKGRPPLPHNAVIPVLSAMQGHPEAPRLWEKHADRILRTIGLTPTTHEPCLYSGVIGGHRILFL